MTRDLTAPERSISAPLPEHGFVVVHNAKEYRHLLCHVGNEYLSKNASDNNRFQELSSMIYLANDRLERQVSTVI